ncbi:PEP/pyruvate-binding domain-containing protein [Nonomuraea typhae]|uniref:PEP/pyruvate-binding domain-containing protein n=1 Tax=Nonomuraea typhae TaxID=2603600 RepID=A0ABW7YST7_9ACTN
MTVVAPLGDFGRDDLDRAGGKGANLGELVRLGLPVPDGFVVTTAAGGDLSDDLRREIAAAYAALGGGPVAVRSSATAEDLPGAAFAGQQDTFLNVTGEQNLIEAVRRCWASLYTERAVAYRARLGIPDAGLRIAVVVQAMVEAESAGVMFTADPVTGERGVIVVDASSGLGEAVVSGRVTPDHYVLDRTGRRTSFRPGRREVVIRGTAGGGTTETHDEPPGERLPDRALRELAGYGVRVADHFGRPMDLEWAYAGGRIHLVQARPMTALPPPPLGRLSPMRRRLATTLIEYLPVRPYPIDMTTWIPHGPAGMMGEVTAAYGIRGAFEDFLEEQDGVVYRIVPPSPRLGLRALGLPLLIWRKARRYDPTAWTRDPRFVDFLRRERELAAVDLAALPWPELRAMPRHALGLVRPVGALRADYLPGAFLSGARLLLAMKAYGVGEHFFALLGGTTRTNDANRALEALATRLGEPDFAQRFTEFLAEYGHRETVSPILVTAPTWADAPDTVMDLVKVLAARPAAAPVDPLERLLTHPRLRKERRRRRIERLARVARAGMAFREDSHFYFTKPMPILRRALVEIGRRLGLEPPEDVFHLRLEELEDVEDPAAAPYRERLRAVILVRAARREELRGVRMIDPRAVFPAPEMGDALVAGTPAGGGTATGPVKVIRTPEEFGRLAAGDVLVCPYTNPSWTPLFQRAAAVVVDTGGPGSHAAIVAREYGLPAVMGTGEGTSILTDGLSVVVDGDTGRVAKAP